MAVKRTLSVLSVRTVGRRDLAAERLRRQHECGDHPGPDRRGRRPGHDDVDPREQDGDAGAGARRHGEEAQPEEDDGRQDGDVLAGDRQDVRDGSKMYGK